MEQLSKFSRIAWMSIAGLMLLKIGLIFLNPTGIPRLFLPWLVDIAIFVLLGGWFVVLHQNCSCKSSLNRPAFIGIIATIFLLTACLVQIVSALEYGSPVISIGAIIGGVAYILLIVAFVLLGRRSPAGKFRKAAYIAAFVPLVSGLISNTIISMLLSYGPYVFFAYTMDTKK